MFQIDFLVDMCMYVRTMEMLLLSEGGHSQAKELFQYFFNMVTETRNDGIMFEFLRETVSVIIKTVFHLQLSRADFMRKTEAGIFASKTPMLLILLEASRFHFNRAASKKFITAIFRDIMNILNFRMSGRSWKRDIQWVDLYTIFLEYLESPTHFQEMNKLVSQYGVLHGLLYVWRLLEDPFLSGIFAVDMGRLIYGRNANEYSQVIKVRKTKARRVKKFDDWVIPELIDETCCYGLPITFRLMNNVMSQFDKSDLENDQEARCRVVNACLYPNLKETIANDRIRKTIRNVQMKIVGDIFSERNDPALIGAYGGKKKKRKKKRKKSLR